MVGDIFQPTHLLFILVVALLVLGPKRLPEVARQLGNGIRDFRSAINGEREERHPVMQESYTFREDEPESAPLPDGHEFAHEPAPEHRAVEHLGDPGGASDAVQAANQARVTATASTDAAPGSAGEHEFAPGSPSAASDESGSSS